MRDFHGKLLVNLLATVVAIIVIIESYAYPELASLFLSVEVIVLPFIYILGNLVSEQLFDAEKEKFFSIVQTKTDEFNEKYQAALSENQRLKYENNFLKWRLKK